ncbi:PDR/VanB family oxidoreductase [Hwanghaeella sp.]|uniref:PDR/VanB family oxidoreductase n=1 Tax=Hwanghaeella sp. TaxID=2605943 RepID=UPI003CCC0EBF
MLDLVIRGKRALAEGIFEFELVAADGSTLPEFSAGGHLPVETPSGGMRQYSLSNNPSERDRYVIGVKLEPEGRGGSRSMIEDTVEGDQLKALPPENDFPLVDAPAYILIAGGIGITPILSMARVLTVRGKPFKLIYCTRSPALTAYEDVLSSGDVSGEITIHHDDGDPDKVYDFWDLFEEPSKAHVYCCGPKPLMEEVKGVTGHWPESAIHFEDFKPVEMFRAADVAFEVTLAKSGRTVTVPVGTTVLDAVRTAGVKVASSCESGTCGTCKTTYLSGNVDHRDLVLMPEEKTDKVMICVSRADEGGMVLDL